VKAILHVLKSEREKRTSLPKEEKGKEKVAMSLLARTIASKCQRGPVVAMSKVLRSNMSTKPDYSEDNILPVSG